MPRIWTAPSDWRRSAPTPDTAPSRSGRSSTSPPGASLTSPVHRACYHYLHAARSELLRQIGDLAGEVVPQVGQPCVDERFAVQPVRRHLLSDAACADVLGRPQENDIRSVHQSLSRSVSLSGNPINAKTTTAGRGKASSSTRSAEPSASMRARRIAVGHRRRRAEPASQGCGRRLATSVVAGTIMVGN